MSEVPPGMRRQINESGGLSNDTRVLMLYEANKKTALVAYILWFFLGLFGGCDDHGPLFGKQEAHK